MKVEVKILNIEAGQTARLGVVVSGSPVPAVWWQHGSHGSPDPVDYSDRISLAPDNASLVIAKVCRTELLLFYT